MSAPGPHAAGLRDRAVEEMVRRIETGWYRYQGLDGNVYERPIGSVLDLAHQFRCNKPSFAPVIEELISRGYLSPASVSGQLILSPMLTPSSSLSHVKSTEVLDVEAAFGAPPRSRRHVRSAIAGAVTEKIAQAVSDPTHPWAIQWPTTIEMALQFGVSTNTVRRVMRELEAQWIVVKARVPPHGQISWVPQEWHDSYPSPPSDDQIASQIITNALDGEWEEIPTVKQLQDHFYVNGDTIVRVFKQLAERGLAQKLRSRGSWRWHIIPQHKRRTVDPRLSVSASQVALVEIIARIQSGEFRYRLPDGTIHERPFLTVVEIQSQYRISEQSGNAIKLELLRRKLITPGPVTKGFGARAQLAERLPVVDRADHPPSSAPRMPGDRAQDVAADLTHRIRAGEFTAGEALNLKATARHYRAGSDNVRTAFDLLHDKGLVKFRYNRKGRFAVVARSLSTSLSHC